MDEREMKSWTLLKIGRENDMDIGNE